MVRQIARSFLWFLLVPYFAVENLNVRPWFGESRAFANQTNAQLIVALILVWPLILVAPDNGWLGGQIRDHPRIFAVVVTVPALGLVNAWIRGDRKRKYSAAYTTMPRRQRMAFGLSTAILMIVPFALGVSNAPDKPSPQPQDDVVKCDPTADHVTADKCS